MDSCRRRYEKVYYERSFAFTCITISKKCDKSMFGM